MFTKRHARDNGLSSLTPLDRRATSRGPGSVVSRFISPAVWMGSGWTVKLQVRLTVSGRKPRWFHCERAASDEQHVKEIEEQVLLSGYRRIDYRQHAKEPCSLLCSLCQESKPPANFAKRQRGSGARKCLCCAADIETRTREAKKVRLAAAALISFVFPRPRSVYPRPRDSDEATKSGVHEAPQLKTLRMGPSKWSCGIQAEPVVQSKSVQVQPAAACTLSRVALKCLVAILIELGTYPRSVSDLQWHAVINALGCRIPRHLSDRLFEESWSMHEDDYAQDLWDGIEFHNGVW